MKAFLKIYWMPILIVLIILAFAVSGMVSDCRGKQVDTLVSQATMNTRLNNQKTELETKYLAANGELFKALQAAEKTISDGLKPQIIYRQAKAAKLVEQARKDTATTALCDSALTAQEQVISDMGTKAKSDSIQLDLSGKRLGLKDSINVVLQKSNDEKDRINDTLNKAVTKAQKGKNAKWYFLGAGAILSFLITR